jgi:hypothetical protein
MLGDTLIHRDSGVKACTTSGSTDELGYKALENVCRVNALHSGMFELMGVSRKVSVPPNPCFT